MNMKSLMENICLKRSKILLILALGTLTVIGCKSPTVDVPVDSCVTSKKFQVSKCGKRIIDYKQARETVGEWQDISKLTIKPLAETDDQVCFSLDNWLTMIKPRLKEGHDFYVNNSSKPKKALVAEPDNESIKEEEIVEVDPE